MFPWWNCTHHGEAIKCIRFLSFHACLEGYRVFAAYSHFTVICVLIHRPVYGKMGDISCFWVNNLLDNTSFEHTSSLYFPIIISSWKRCEREIIKVFEYEASVYRGWSYIFKYLKMQTENQWLAANAYWMVPPTRQRFPSGYDYLRLKWLIIIYLSQFTNCFCLCYNMHDKYSCLFSQINPASVSVVSLTFKARKLFVFWGSSIQARIPSFDSKGKSLLVKGVTFWS